MIETKACSVCDGHGEVPLLPIPNDPQMFDTRPCGACDARGEVECRQYVVGLPVIITVGDDGSVSYWIDTSEASEAVLEAESEHPQTQINTDASIVEWTHDQEASK